MKIKKVTIAGGGVLGSQIAFQSAYCGFDVAIYLRNEKAVLETQDKIDVLKKTYIEAINEMEKGGEWCAGISDAGKKIDKKNCLENVEKAAKSIKYITDLEESVKGADLVIEAISEVFNIKKDFYTGLAPLLDEKTLLVTNSSTLLPSALSKFTGRPEKFLALHFANTIWRNNTAEVMRHELTDPENFDTIVKFANDIRMFALPIEKEKAGYLLNSLLVPFLMCAMDMLANGISTPEAIDSAWTRGTGAPKGPFQIMDIVGLATALNIVDQYQKVPGLLSPLLRKMMFPYNFKGIKALLEEYMAAGKTGVAAGEGFYKYED